MCLSRHSYSEFRANAFKIPIPRKRSTTAYISSQSTELSLKHPQARLLNYLNHHFIRFGLTLAKALQTVTRFLWENSCRFAEPKSNTFTLLRAPNRQYFPFAFFITGKICPSRVSKSFFYRSPNFITISIYIT